MKKLKIEEQETIIRWMRDEDHIEIYTCDSAMMNKLDKKVTAYPGVYKMTRQDEYGKWYECQKNLVGFRKPSRELTENEKKERVERVRKSRDFYSNEAVPDTKYDLT